MQRRVLLGVAVVLLLGAVAFVGASSSSSSLFPAFPTPAFLWSGNNFFSGQKESLETYYSDLVTDFVIKATKHETTGNALFKFVTDKSPLETIVLFIDPKPALSNEFYSFLQPILSQTGSLILPYVYKSASLSTTSENILFDVPEGQKVIVSNTQSGNLQREQLVEFIGQNSVIFSNGVTDVIVVYLEKQENRAAFVESVNNAIKARTTSYLALMIADTDYTREEDNNHDRQVRDIVTRTDYANSTYWPRGIWEGLLVALLLLSIFGVGLWCTSELQTPTKWEKPKPMHVHAQ